MLIHNVGERDRRPFAEIEPEDFARLIDVDLSAAYALVRLVVPGMIERGWGRVILVTSIAGQLAVPGASSYIAAKGGLAALARALAAELGATGHHGQCPVAGLFRHRDQCPADGLADGRAPARALPGQALGRAGGDRRGCLVPGLARRLLRQRPYAGRGRRSLGDLSRLKGGESVIAEHFARRWQKAGLIDDDLARRIVDWEIANRRPVVLWAIAGMGALAMALGVMAIVGANWESIPAWLKLAVDLGLNGACAVAVFVFWRQQRLWLREIAALLLFGLVLSGIALIGQVYQLQSDPWRALVLWLALCTPFLALTAQTRLTGTIWAIAAVTTWVVAGDPIHDLLARIAVLPARRQYWEFGLLFFQVMGYLAACAMIVLASLRRLWPEARGQADLLMRLAIAGLIATCSLAMAFAWREAGDGGPLGPIVAAAIATLLAAAALWSTHAEAERRILLVLLATSFAVWIVALLISGFDGKQADLARAVLFIAYWGVVGTMAARAGARALFGLAFSMIGLRLLVLYFEAIGGLTATGLGLIGGGVLCLALAAIGWRLMRRMPRRPAGAAA